MKYQSVFLIPVFLTVLSLLPMNLQAQGGGTGTGATVCVITVNPPCANFVTPSAPCSQGVCDFYPMINEATGLEESTFGCYYAHERYVANLNVWKTQDIVPGTYGRDTVNTAHPPQHCANKKKCSCSGKNVGQHCFASGQLFIDPSGDIPQETATGAVCPQGPN